MIEAGVPAGRYHKQVSSEKHFLRIRIEKRGTYPFVYVCMFLV